MADGAIPGPGTLGVNTGVALAFYAAIDRTASVAMLLTSNEETRSASLRALIEQPLQEVAAALVPEASAGGSGDNLSVALGTRSLDGPGGVGGDTQAETTTLTPRRSQGEACSLTWLIHRPRAPVSPDKQVPMK